MYLPVKGEGEEEEEEEEEESEEEEEEEESEEEEEVFILEDSTPDFGSYGRIIYVYAP